MHDKIYHEIKYYLPFIHSKRLLLTMVIHLVSINEKVINRPGVAGAVL